MLLLRRFMLDITNTSISSHIEYKRQRFYIMGNMLLPTYTHCNQLLQPTPTNAVCQYINVTTHGGHGGLIIYRQL